MVREHISTILYKEELAKMLRLIVIKIIGANEPTPTLANSEGSIALYLGSVIVQ